MWLSWGSQVQNRVWVTSLVSSYCFVWIYQLYRLLGDRRILGCFINLSWCLDESFPSLFDIWFFFRNLWAFYLWFSDPNLKHMAPWRKCHQLNLIFCWYITRLDCTIQISILQHIWPQPLFSVIHLISDSSSALPHIQNFDQLYHMHLLYVSFHIFDVAKEQFTLHNCSNIYQIHPFGTPWVFIGPRLLLWKRRICPDLFDTFQRSFLRSSSVVHQSPVYPYAKAQRTH